MRHVLLRSRARLVAFALFLLVATQAAANTGKAALDLVPKDAVGLVVVNFERLKSSPTYAELFKMLSATPDMQQGLKMMKDEFGIELDKHISTVVVAVPGFQNQDEPLVLVEGTFDEKKIVAAGKKQSNGKSVESKHAGHTVYQFDGEGAVAFVRGHLVVGPLASVKKSLDAEKSKQSLQKNAAVMKLVGAATTDKDLWFVVDLPAEVRKQMAQNDPQAADVHAVRGSLDLKAGLGLKIDVTTANDKAAAAMADKARQQLTQAAGDASLKMMGFGTVFSKTKVEAKGTNLAVSIDLTKPELDALKTTVMGMMAMMQAGGMGGPQGGPMAPPPPAQPLKPVPGKP